MPPKKKSRSKKKTRRIGRDKIASLVERFEGEVNNGGFDQFFRNSSGNETAEILEALQIIGASDAADILQRAAKRFPGGKPPRDWAKREELMQKSFPGTAGFKDLDQEFYACSEEIEGWLERYMGWV